MKNIDRKCKIAYIVNGFPLLSEAFFINQIVDLINKGHEVVVFASQLTPEPYHEKVYSYNLHEKVIVPPHFGDSLFSKLILFLKYTFSHPKYFFKIIRFLQKKSVSTNWHAIYWLDELLKGNYDVVHAHFANNGLTIVDFKRVGFLSNIPLVTTFHGFDMALVPNYDNLDQYGDLFTVNSNYTRKIAVTLGVSDEKIIKLPVGLDTNYFQPNPLRDSQVYPFKIIFVGRLVEFKAPELVILICSELVKRGYDIHCTLIGAGKLKSKLELMIEELELTKIVDIKGALSQQDVIHLMSTSDLFLLPGIVDSTGRAENQGLVIQEAQSMELPIIISDAGGMKEGMIDGITGFVVKEKNIDEFVTKIVYLIENKDEVKQMGLAGRLFVVENFDSKVLGDQLIAVYKCLLKGDMKN